MYKRTIKKEIITVLILICCLTGCTTNSKNNTTVSQNHTDSFQQIQVAELPEPENKNKNDEQNNTEVNKHDNINKPNDTVDETDNTDKSDNDKDTNVVDTETFFDKQLKNNMANATPIGTQVTEDKLSIVDKIPETEVVEMLNNIAKQYNFKELEIKEEPTERSMNWIYIVCFDRYNYFTVKCYENEGCMAEQDKTGTLFNMYDTEGFEPDQPE